MTLKSFSRNINQISSYVTKDEDFVFSFIRLFGHGLLLLCFPKD